jgi:hypothetical protein
MMDLNKIEIALDNLGYEGVRAFRSERHLKITDEQYQESDVANTISLEALKAELVNVEAAEQAVAYRVQRSGAYPSIGDQLDMIYRAGLGGEEFQTAIQAVKDAYPKPE